MPSVFSPLVSYWYVDDNGDYYYEYEPEYYDNNDDDFYDPYNNDNEFKEEDLYEGLPEYDRDDLEDATVVDTLDYYRYLLNVIFVAIPFTIVDILCIGWNLWFNAKWNEAWADGNMWLMVNTVYILIQGVAAFMLAFELPIWLVSFRVFRFWSFVLAITYNFIFFCLALEWWDMLYIVSDKTKYDFVDIFINMCLGYNIILHFTIIPINLFIIGKEISMEYFQFLRGDAGTESDNISLSEDDYYRDYYQDY